jgi:hypothetical protein
LIKEYEKRAIPLPDCFYITGSVAGGKRNARDIDLTVVEPSGLGREEVGELEENVRDICEKLNIDFYFSMQEDGEKLDKGVDPYGGVAVSKEYLIKKETKK